MEIKDTVKRVIKYIILAVIMVVFLFPVYWVAATSLKLETEWVASPPIWIPSKLILDNYILVFTGSAEALALFSVSSLPPAGPPLINSIVIAGGATVAAVLIGYLAAYAIARLGTGGSFMYYFVLMTRMLPPISIAIPLIIIIGRLALRDTYQGMIYMYTGFTVAYAIWMMKSFIDEVPVDIEEAAQMDGYTRREVIFTITLPLVKGGLVAAGLFILILNWSEFAYALLFTDTRATTITLQIQRYFAQQGVLYGPVAAVALTSTIPLMIFGYLIQKHLVRGLTFGAVRGRR